MRLPHPALAARPSPPPPPQEKLSREDVWLDRLVQWKKWVATEKLRLVDAKVRAAGSPQRDPALARLLEAAAAAATAAPPTGASMASADDEAAPASAAAAPAPGSPPAAEGGPLPGGAVERDARFMARFSIAPVSDADLDALGASILVSGPRGVRMEAVPARTTLARLLASGAVSEAEARRCSVRLNGQAVPVLAAREVVLRPGDHVAFVQEPNLAPRVRPVSPARPGRGGAAAEGAGELDVYLPGGGAPLRVPLRRPAGAGAAAAAAVVS
jgi:hypothetical protein